MRDAEPDMSLNMSVPSEERSDNSLFLNDSIVKADKESDQTLWDLMMVTGELGFCEFKHPVSYKSLDQRNMCDAYPERQNELYNHMNNNHMEVAEMLDNIDVCSENISKRRYHTENAPSVWICD